MQIGKFIAKYLIIGFYLASIVQFIFWLNMDADFYMDVYCEDHQSMICHLPIIGVNEEKYR